MAEGYYSRNQGALLFERNNVNLDDLFTNIPLDSGVIEGYNYNDANVPSANDGTIISFSTRRNAKFQFAFDMQGDIYFRKYDGTTISSWTKKRSPIVVEISGTTSENGVIRTFYTVPILSASTEISGAYVSIIWNGTDWTAVIRDFWSGNPIANTSVTLKLVVLNS